MYGLDRSLRRPLSDTLAQARADEAMSRATQIGALEAQLARAAAEIRSLRAEVARTGEQANRFAAAQVDVDALRAAMEVCVCVCVCV
jgi:molecular chaperone GrpE (heat shock protein)